jgi:hypothetical protein
MQLANLRAHTLHALFHNVSLNRGAIACSCLMKKLKNRIEIKVIPPRVFCLSLLQSF